MELEERHAPESSRASVGESFDRHFSETHGPVAVPPLRSAATYR
jgi:hypothetical protein